MGLVEDGSQENLDEYLSSEQKEDEDICVVFDTNIDTFFFFQSISNYWQYGAMGGILSLDWPTIMAQVSRYDMYSEDELYDFYGFRKVTLRMIKGVQIIESVARNILNDRLK